MQAMVFRFASLIEVWMQNGLASRLDNRLVESGLKTKILWLTVRAINAKLNGKASATAEAKL